MPHMSFGAFTGQSATVLPFLKRVAVSEDVLQVVAGLSDAFDEAEELLSAPGIELVTAEAFEAAMRSEIIGTNTANMDE